MNAEKKPDSPAKRKGRADYKLGRLAGDNPYQYLSRQWQDWKAGWMDAVRSEQDDSKAKPKTEHGSRSHGGAVADSRW